MHAIAMRALVMPKRLPNEPILQADVQIPELPLSESFTVIFGEHVHERTVDYSTGLLEHPPAMLSTSGSRPHAVAASCSTSLKGGATFLPHTAYISATASSDGNNPLIFTLVFVVDLCGSPMVLFGSLSFFLVLLCCDSVRRIPHALLHVAFYLYGSLLLVLFVCPLYLS